MSGVPPAVWPGLSVVIGGIPVAYEDAAGAVLLLAASRTSAIAPVLGHARSPLAAVDYFAVAAPYLALARALPKTGRAGAAGRHVTKTAFIAAVAEACVAAQQAQLAGILEAFSSDERYMAAVCAEAVAYRRREHARNGTGPWHAVVHAADTDSVHAHEALAA